MKWNIERSRFDATNLMVNTTFEPKNDVLRYSLAQISINNYPEFISFQAKSISYGEEHVHIKNFKDMDWEDLAWAKNVKGTEISDGEIFLVHDVMGKTIIKEILFDQILYDYGSKVFEIYQSDTSLSETWKDDMIHSLEKLKSKINNKSPDREDLQANEVN